MLDSRCKRDEHVDNVLASSADESPKSVNTRNGRPLVPESSDVTSRFSSNALQ